MHATMGCFARANAVGVRPLLVIVLSAWLSAALLMIRFQRRSLVRGRPGAGLLVAAVSHRASVPPSLAAWGDVQGREWALSYERKRGRGSGLK
jgi:hypothetical protein